MVSLAKVERKVRKMVAARRRPCVENRNNPELVTVALVLVPSDPGACRRLVRAMRCHCDAATRSRTAGEAQTGATFA
jgi:hypothetical protein